MRRIALVIVAASCAAAIAASAALTMVGARGSTVGVPPDVCSDRGFAATLDAVRHGRFYDRPGSFELASRTVACRWQDDPHKVTALHGVAVGGAVDDLGEALVNLVTGRIDQKVYADQALDLVARLTAASPTLQVTTASVVLDLAAGACLNRDTAACYRDFSQRVLPTTTRLDTAANLAFGDLLGRDLPAVAPVAARNTVSEFIHNIGLRPDAAVILPEALTTGARGRRTLFSTRYHMKVPT